MVPIGSHFIRNRSYFIKENIANLEKHILFLSEEQISDHLKEIYKLTQTEFFELYLLNKFLKRITKKKEYYYQKQYSSYHWTAFFWAILMFFLLLLMLILYWHCACAHTLCLSLTMVVTTFYLMKKIYNSLYQWYNPNYEEYKKYHKQYSFIEKKLQQKINNLRKKITNTSNL